MFHSFAPSLTSFSRSSRGGAQSRVRLVGEGDAGRIPPCSPVRLARDWSGSVWCGRFFASTINGSSPFPREPSMVKNHPSPESPPSITIPTVAGMGSLRDRVGGGHVLKSASTTEGTVAHTYQITKQPNNLTSTDQLTYPHKHPTIYAPTLMLFYFIPYLPTYRYDFPRATLSPAPYLPGQPVLVSLAARVPCCPTCLFRPDARDPIPHPSSNQHPLPLPPCAPLPAPP
jgi:hypothetical protein